MSTPAQRTRYTAIILIALSLMAVWHPVAHAQNWVKVFEQSAGSVYGLTCAPNSEVFAGCDSGVFATTNDGLDWTSSNAGLVHKQVLCLTFAPNGTLLAGGTGGVFRSTDRGASWATSNIGLPENSHIIALAWDRENNFYAGDSSVGAYFSSDDGRHWVQKNNGLSTPPGVSRLTVAPNGDVYAGCSNVIFRSSDRADNWTASKSLQKFGRIDALGADSVGGVFAGTSTFPGYSRTRNDGMSWEDLLPGPVTVDFSAFAFSNMILLGGTSDHGIMSSNDEGDHWDFKNIGIPNSSHWITSLTIPTSTFVFAGTQDGAIFRTVNALLNGVERPNLESNRIDCWPQPFTSNATLGFFLPHAGRVSLRLRDGVGRELATLFEGVMEAGYHKVNIDGRQLLQGVYIAELKSESGLRIIRLVHAD